MYTVTTEVSGTTTRVYVMLQNKYYTFDENQDLDLKEDKAPLFAVPTIMWNELKGMPKMESLAPLVQSNTSFEERHKNELKSLLTGIIRMQNQTINNLITTVYGKNGQVPEDSGQDIVSRPPHEEIRGGGKGSGKKSKKAPSRS